MIRAAVPLILAVVLGLIVGVVEALSGSPRPAGDGCLMFSGVLIGAGVMTPRRRPRAHRGSR